MYFRQRTFSKRTFIIYSTDLAGSECAVYYTDEIFRASAILIISQLKTRTQLL